MFHCRTHKFIQQVPDGVIERRGYDVVVLDEAGASGRSERRAARAARAARTARAMLRGMAGSELTGFPSGLERFHVYGDGMLHEPLPDVFAQLLNDHLPAQGAVLGDRDEGPADENRGDKGKVKQLRGEGGANRSFLGRTELDLVATGEQVAVRHELHDLRIRGHFGVHRSGNGHGAKVEGAA